MDVPPNLTKSGIYLHFYTQITNIFFFFFLRRTRQHSQRYLKSSTLFCYQAQWTNRSDPPTNWHTVALVRYGRHYFIFSNFFNFYLYQNSNIATPRIRDQKGLMQMYRLLSFLQSKKKKLRFPTLPSRQTVSQKPMKGRGYKNK